MGKGSPRDENTQLKIQRFGRTQVSTKKTPSKVGVAKVGLNAM